MSIRKRKFTSRPLSALFRIGVGGKSDSLPMSRRAKLGGQSSSFRKSIFAFGCGALAILFTLSFLHDSGRSIHRVFFSGASAGDQLYGGGQDVHAPERPIGDNISISQHNRGKQGTPARIGVNNSIPQKDVREKDISDRIGDGFGQRQELVAHLSNYTEFVGFLRVAKTASTSVMRFLLDPKDGLYNLNSFLQTNYVQGAYGCIFASSHEDTSRRDRNVHPSCPHVPYFQLKNQWYKSLPLIDVKPTNTQHRYSFHPFSMVRDPFDRMVSFFYFMQKTIPHWSLSEQQDEKILADDFFGWWKVLVQENMKVEDDTLSIPYMYEAFDYNLDAAIELISGDLPEIMITTSDCVDMSLRLLSTLKPQFFGEEKVEHFLHSASNHSNARDKSIPAKYFNRTLAREMHKAMFPEDWKFYNAALKQMKRTMMGTDLKDRFENDYSTCMDKLDSKITESGTV